MNQGPFGFLFGDKLLLVAHGTVVAGIDLGRLEPGDVRIDAQGAVYMVIPAAEVFVATLDNEKSYVYHRETGILAPGTKDLEFAARKAAQEEILKAALEDGILTTALTNGKAYLQRFLMSLGLKNVVFIDATPVPAGSTAADPDGGYRNPLRKRRPVKHPRIFILIAVLFFASLACNLPGPVTPGIGLPPDVTSGGATWTPFSDSPLTPTPTVPPLTAEMLRNATYVLP